jgi:hypothetical protein
MAVMAIMAVMAVMHVRRTYVNGVMAETATMVATAGNG